MFSDVIPSGFHPVTRTITIQNCNEYNDTQIMDYISGTLSGRQQLTTIDIDGVIPGIYKYDNMYLFGIKKSVLEEIGGIDNLTVDYVLNKINPVMILTPSSYLVEDKIILIDDDLFYNIESINDNILTIKLVKRVLTFEDGKMIDIAF